MICGGGHAVSGEKGVWHDCGEGGGHAGEGKRGIGMTVGREAVMPGGGEKRNWHDIGERGSHAQKRGKEDMA